MTSGATELGTDTQSTQAISRTSNSVSVETQASTSSLSSAPGGQVGGQAGGQGSAIGGEMTGAGVANPASSTAGAWPAVKTAGAGVLGLAIGAIGMAL